MIDKPAGWPAREVHLAGIPVTVSPGFMRQRCSWCGTILIDYDLSRIKVPAGDPFPPSSWPTGVFIAMEGPFSRVVESGDIDDAQRIPDGSCMLIDPSATR